MDKTAEIYRTPPKTPQVQPQEPLSSYTLFPDAGDPEALTEPVPLPPTAPATSALPPPQPSQSARISIPRQPTVHSPAPRETVRSTPRLHRLPLRIFSVLLALTAVVVYGDLLISGGASLFAQGLDRLALRNIFGTAQDISVIPRIPETAVTAQSETDPPVKVPPDAAPPAAELPVPAVDAAILSRDLSSDAPNGLDLINETPYTPDLAALAARPSVIDSYAALESIYGKGCPAVLILHTHGTEAFADQASAGYHTEKRSENICAVGEALADTLTEAGIGVIHCTELFDADSFDMAYYNAARYIRQTLEEYPSIRYILDVHRDAITAEDGTGIRPLSLQNDTEYAQLMFVVGTDHGGSGHTGWETNLALAARLQSALHTENPTLMRDINLRSASFNAQYAPGSLLVEAGAAASSMEEAIRSIEVFGKALAKEILGE